MSNLTPNTRVHVPAKSVGLDSNYPFAMVECKYVRKKGLKGVLDDIPRVQGSRSLDLRLISQKLGFLIVQVGDFDTEKFLLDPLHTAIVTTTELVLKPDNVWSCHIRSIAEFRKFWVRQNAIISHLVIVGHGSQKGLIFGDEVVDAKEFIEALSIPESQGQAPIIISLACKSGNTIFGKSVSGSGSCRAFIGPSGTIHASNAALFYQSFLSHNLLEGRTNEKAYQKARVFTPGVTEFNMWQKTKLVHKPNRIEVLGYSIV